MTTKAIFTHQPEVGCDVCGRRLLRGERPDTFLHAGERRTVCELCAPRALGAGWTRASAAPEEATEETEGRQRHSLIGRLRGRRRAAEPADLDAAGDPREHDEATSGSRSGRRRRSARRGGESRPRLGGPFDLEEDAEHEYSHAYAGAADPQDEPDAVPDGASLALGEDLATAGHDVMAQFEQEGATTGTAGESGFDGDETCFLALELFNASEAARRIGGIARALGEPCVTVRLLEDGAEKVAIVVAWELCWYRYEVDLASQPATIALLAEGMELEELPGEDRAANARADERGELSLVL